MSADGDIRYDWSVEEILALLDLPLLDLIGRANGVHRHRHNPARIHKASLISVKTGGCPEDCAYCPQSAHHEVALTRQLLMDPAAVVRLGERAKAAGAERVCMAAAWRAMPDGPEFEAILTMVAGIHALGLESCVSGGMLRADQAERLAAAGLTAYNHNLDSGPDFYGHIVTTRTHADRLATLATLRQAGIALCCGGIIGMGETPRDRAALLQVLATLTPHPEHVPINVLVPVPGTPLADRPPLDPLELVRMIAAARLALPDSVVRLSAGRATLSPETQVLCFLAGANSVFWGDVLLTTPNATPQSDAALFQKMSARA